MLQVTISLEPWTPAIDEMVNLALRISPGSISTIPLNPAQAHRHTNRERDSISYQVQDVSRTSCFEAL